MPRLDLDIEAMKLDILRRQQEAMKPFQEELRNLEIIEGIVERNGKPKRRGPEHTLPVKGWLPEKTRRRAKRKSNGAAPYAGLTQPGALKEILQKEPLLTAKEITARMVEGGFPFATSRPDTSVTTLLGQRKDELKVTKGRSEEGRHVNRYRLKTTP